MTFIDIIYQKSYYGLGTPTKQVYLISCFNEQYSPHLTFTIN